MASSPLQKPRKRATTGCNSNKNAGVERVLGLGRLWTDLSDSRVWCSLFCTPGLLTSLVGRLFGGLSLSKSATKLLRPGSPESQSRNSGVGSILLALKALLEDGGALAGCRLWPFSTTSTPENIECHNPWLQALFKVQPLGKGLEVVVALDSGCQLPGRSLPGICQLWSFELCASGVSQVPANHATHPGLKLAKAPLCLVGLAGTESVSVKRNVEVTYLDECPSPR